MDHGAAQGKLVIDKVEFAYALIARYDPFGASALGLDLDPGTGLPRHAESLPSGLGQQAL